MNKIVRIRQTKRGVISWLGAGLSVVFFATHTSAQTQAATPACIQITVSSVVETPTVPTAKPSSGDSDSKARPVPVFNQSSRAATVGSAVNLTGSGSPVVVASSQSADSGLNRTAGTPLSATTKGSLTPYYQQIPVTGTSIASPNPGWFDANRMAVAAPESDGSQRLGSRLKTHFSHK